MDQLGDYFYKTAVLAPSILMALTLHEVSHGVVALFLGDPTAKNQGRLSFNPLKHLDPMGTIVFFVTAWIGAGIGWAKPVPVNYFNLKNPHRGQIWIAAAGPAANLALAALLAMLLHWLINLGFFVPEFGYSMQHSRWIGRASFIQFFVMQVMFTTITINVVLAFFNLIPLPPLDGSGVVAGLLSPQAAARYRRIGRYGFFIILGLIFLPGWLPGFPNIIHLLVLSPARWLLSLILPS